MGITHRANGGNLKGTGGGGGVPLDCQFAEGLATMRNMSDQYTSGSPFARSSEFTLRPG